MHIFDSRGNLPKSFQNRVCQVTTPPSVPILKILAHIGIIRLSNYVILVDV
jgi:hypothetical protein